MTAKSAITLIDNLIHQSELMDNNNDLFTDKSFPKVVLNKMWSYLIDEAPFDDVLTLTCKAFRNLTYNHPSHASRFHFRLEPQFKLNNPSTNHNKFQIGAAVTPATRRAILVPNINAAITKNKNITFPFHSLKVFNVAQSCQLKDVIPFFVEFKDNIKFMSWNSCKFLNQPQPTNTDQKEQSSQTQVIKHPFTACILFSLLTRRRWQINLNAKFPKLLCFSYTIEWYDHFDQIQEFLDSHSSSMVIIFLEFNFNLPKNIRERWEQEANPTRLTLTLPPNIEICVLSCLNATTSKYIDIDFSQCRHKLKHLVCLMNSVKMCNPMFLDGEGNKTLEFLVINDIDGVHAIPWDALKIGTNSMNKIKNIYVPCTPEFANKISVNCIGEFPDLESVKESIESVGARQVLRDLNCEQRRHWLWGLFWFERHGIGMKKLKQLEMEWKRQQSTEYF